VHFHARLRGTRRFDTIPELVQQIGEDIAQARSLPSPLS
jgi:FAD synthase